MSQPKLPQSGLRTATRNFSSNPRSNDEPIVWSKDQTDPKAERLKHIQAGISQRAACGLENYSGITTAHIGSGIKRPFPGAPDDPLERKRRLPSNWGDDPLIQSSAFVGASSSRHLAAVPSRTDVQPITASVAKSSLSNSSAPTIALSNEQKHILQLVEEGKSIFYTGSAGTGKSVLLREIIKSLRKRYYQSTDAIAVTASTGIAACNIGGITIHSFSGIGTGDGSPENLITKVRKNKKACSRWARTKVLIIDEVSMLDGDLFDKLSTIGSSLRKSKAPFGGIQIVVTGDFFQLPPVSKDYNGTVKFAFEAQIWDQAITRTFNLTKVFRQRDEEFVQLLNQMRFGNLSASAIARFKSLSRHIDYGDGIGPTELFPRREDVEQANRLRMMSLTTEEREYDATDGGTLAKDQRDKILTNFMAPEKLTLRIGAQVMLIKNMDETLVNGSMGKVVRFCQRQFYGTEQDDVDSSGKPKGEKRKPTTNDMFLPIVEFVLPNKTRRETLILPETWKVEQPDGDVQVSRMQLPLILAWAMSIHKSQGQTLERVRVDLARVFEKGQAYVALSRATSLDGLQVLSFNPDKVKAHPKVVKWSKKLEILVVD